MNKIVLQIKFLLFEDKLSEIMSLCDFAITRAGASTLSELVSLKIPFLAIPFPFSKDDHQYFNAKFMWIKILVGL